MKKKVFNFKNELKAGLNYFNEYGFCIFKNIVSKDYIININKEIKDIVQNQSKKHLSKKERDEAKNTDECLIKLSKKNDEFRSRIYNVIQDLPSVQKFSLNKNFLKIVKILGISIPLIKTAQIRMDMPNKNKFLIPPHQEIKNIKSPNMIFFNTALKKITDDMGAINISPKSFNLGPIIPRVSKGLNYQYIDKKLYFKKYPLKYFEFNKGETLLMNMLTIHGSRKNITKDKIRWSAIVRYEDANNMPYLDLNDTYKNFNLKG